MVKDVKIFIGADHAGFEFKEKLKDFLKKKGYTLNDMGPYVFQPNDDYPDFAFKVAENVSRYPGSRGILVCGTGAGMSIAANKVRGVRAVEAYDAYSAKMSREHNDANVLALRARDFSEAKMKKIATIWLKTDFSKDERHDRRIRKILHFESSHHG